MNRLWVKLTLAFLLVALAAVGMVAAVAVRATRSEFRQYVVRSSISAQPRLAESLVAFYADSGSWSGVDELLASAPGMGMMGRGRGAMGFRLAVADADGTVVGDAAGELVGERLSDSALQAGTPLILNGEQVGTLLSLATADMMIDEPGQAFLDAVRRSLTWAGLAALALALALGLLTSWRLTAPLRRLTTAASGIAAGDLSQRVPAEGEDELAALGQAFNGMAENLEEAEALRRHVMADVAHELRTPLAVIQGNLQAMLDGVYPVDQEQIASLYDETRLLTRLVDDVRDLALAEAGQLRLERAPLDLRAVAQSAVSSFAAPAEGAGITLRLDAAPAPVMVEGDADRLGQVLRNLVSNALRHTPAGGEVDVVVAPGDPGVQMVVRDTGSGIAPEDIPHVFDRFYRAEKSRSRRGGGSGLGLAIARQLVLAHGGEIAVASQPGAGATFTVTLPGAGE